LNFQRTKLAAGILKLSRLMRRSTFQAGYLFNGSTISVGNGEAQATFDYGEDIAMPSVVVPASALDQFLTGKGDATISIVPSGNKVTISCNGTRFVASTLEPHNVPLSEGITEGWWDCGEQVAEAVKAASLWAAGGGKRIDQDHLQMTPVEGGLFLISSAGVAFSCARVDCENTLLCTIFIPDTMVGVITSAEGPFQLVATERRIGFREGPFTAYHALYQDRKTLPLAAANNLLSTPLCTTVNREAFTEILKGAVGACSSMSLLDSVVNLVVTKPRLVIRKTTPESSYEAAVDGVQDKEGADIDIWMAANQVARGMGGLKGNEVAVFASNDRSRPIVVREPGKQWPAHAFAQCVNKG
jgi:hypothetical protein